MPEIHIKVTSMQVTVVPTREGGFIGTVSATLTAESGAAPAAVKPTPTRQPDPQPTRSDDRTMSDAQRRMLWRLATQLGHRGEDAAGFLRARLGINDLADATKSAASRLISALEVESRGNGKESGDAA